MNDEVLRRLSYKIYLVIIGEGRTIAKASLSLAASRAVAMLVPFLIVPIAIHYLGVERYGLWMSATSFVVIMMSFSDGGVSNAIVTATAKTRGRGGDNEIRKILGSATAMFVALAAVIMIIALVIVPIVPWRHVFNLSDNALARDAEATVATVVLGYVLGFIANIVLKVRTGLQQIPAVSAWEAAAIISTIPALFLAVHLRLEMVWLVAAVVITPSLVKGLGSGIFLARNNSLVPGVSDFDRRQAQNLLAGGSVFFVASLTNALAVQLDQILIANMVGTADVATYSVVQRLFSVPWLLVNIVVAAQWPAYTSAAAEHNFEWIKGTFWRTLHVAVGLTILMSLVLLYYHRIILALWVGPEVVATFLLVTGMTAYANLLVVWSTCSLLLISLDARKEQIALNVAMLTVKVPLSILLIREMGAAGAIYGTIISYFLCMVLPSGVIIPRLLNRLIGFRNGSDMPISAAPEKI